MDQYLKCNTGINVINNEIRKTVYKFKFQQLKNFNNLENIEGST